MSDSSCLASSASMFVRIRPLAKEGGHASRKAGEKVSKNDLKRLKAYDENCVTVNDLKTRQDHDFKYMKQVIMPEDSQEDTFNKMGMADMMDKFLSGYNATFLAYGQTGTGKTHTMFGSRLDKIAKHQDESFPEDWGIFPRAVITALKKLNERGGKFVLSANVIEIYFFYIYDLLNEKQLIAQYTGGNVDISGAFEIEVKNSEDVDRLVKIMHTQRQRRGTVMNDSSSRSHCVACLNLMRIEGEDDERKVFRSTFTFVDMSGSERLEKTGMEAKSTTASFEGLCTNWDLFHFGRCIELAKEASKKGKKLRTVRESVLARVLAGTLDGEAITAMVITLSQSEKNGGETWCSLKFGETVNLLEVNAQKVEGKNVSILVREKQKVLESERAALAKLESTPAGRSNKFYNHRKAAVSQLEHDLKFMEKFN